MENWNEINTLINRQARPLESLMCYEETYATVPNTQGNRLSISCTTTLTVLCPRMVSPPENHIETLEKVQRRAARWVCARWDASSFSWSKSYKQCCSELKWLSLNKRRDLSICCQIYKIVNHLDCIDFNKYLALSGANTRRYLSL